MGYAIGAGGLIGTLILAYGLFGRAIYPRWKRAAILLIGLTLTVTFWIVHPQLFSAKEDGAADCDPWDGGHFNPEC